MKLKNDRSQSKKKESFSHEANFKTKNYKVLYIMIHGSIQHEEVIIMNIYLPNGSALHFVKQILLQLKVEISSSRVIMRELKELQHPI